MRPAANAGRSAAEKGTARVATPPEAARILDVGDVKYAVSPFTLKNAVATATSPPYVRSAG